MRVTYEGAFTISTACPFIRARSRQPTIVRTDPRSMKRIRARSIVRSAASASSWSRASTAGREDASSSPINTTVTRPSGPYRWISEMSFDSYAGPTSRTCPDQSFCTINSYLGRSARAALDVHRRAQPAAVAEDRHDAELGAAVLAFPLGGVFRAERLIAAGRALQPHDLLRIRPRPFRVGRGTSGDVAALVGEHLLDLRRCVENLEIPAVATRQLGASDHQPDRVEVGEDGPPQVDRRVGAFREATELSLDAGSRGLVELADQLDGDPAVGSIALNECTCRRH